MKIAWSQQATGRMEKNVLGKVIAIMLCTNGLYFQGDPCTMNVSLEEYENKNRVCCLLACDTL
jgi:hypothetical protein